MAGGKKFAPPVVQETTPALAAYTDNVLFGDVWERAELPKRDRSVVTVSALIAGGHTAQMTGHFNRALDNGVKPGEIAGIITHLAFYCGWPRSMSAVRVLKEVFAARGVTVDPGVEEGGEVAGRGEEVGEEVGALTPALGRYTETVLSNDLWRRGDLAARDRSLATVAALIAAGHVEQLAFHLKQGVEHGLSRTEVAEVVTHLAFYAGWPRAMSAVPVVKAVFEAGRGEE
jgi:4-carboxymuconolactone decarboxylase